MSDTLRGTTTTVEPSQTDLPQQRRPWRVLQLAATAAVLAAFALPMLLEGKVEGFLLAMAAPFVVGLVLSIWLRRTSAILLGVVSLLILLMSVPFVAGALVHPEALADFLSGAFLILGTLIAAVAAIPAFREAGGRAVAPRAARALGVGAAAIAGIAIVASVVASAGVDSVAAQPGDLEVRTEDFSFHPALVTAAAGKVAVHVVNNDSARHTFTIDGLADVSVAPGSSQRVEFDAAPGTYRFYCEPHASDMDGQLKVQ